MGDKLPIEVIDNLKIFLNHKDNVVNQIGAITLNNLGVIPYELLQCMIDKNKFDLVSLEIEEDGSYKTKVDLGCFCNKGNLEEVMSTIHKVKNLIGFEYCCELFTITNNLRDLKRIEEWSSALNEFPDNQVEFLFDVFTEMKHLRKLEIQFHELKYIPNNIDKLQFLEVLNIVGNKVKDLPYSMSSLSSLRALGLSQNCFLNLPDFIADLESLEYLSIGGNPMTLIPPILFNMKQLKTLSINDPQTFADGEIERIKNVLGGDVVKTDLYW